MVHGTTPRAMRQKGSGCFVQIAMNQYRDEKSTDNLVGPPVGIQGEGQVGWGFPNINDFIIEND
jgi:hypothetical protein